MPLYCDYNSLKTESDVEQKFLYPFLSSPDPLGLALPETQILTKSKLKRKIIGKGQSQKYYFPDYLISIRGIPVLVVEAKKPETYLADAYAEARLYAAEVNANFPHNVSVCQYIIVSNGTETWAGYSDQADPVIKLAFDDFNAESTNFIKLLDFCSKKTLEKIANKPYINARGKAGFHTPVSPLGGKRVQNEELEENSFGRTFIFENRNIFDPETEEDRLLIVENAYISSAKREQHIEPIYKEIRKFELPSVKNTTPLATSNPKELVQTFTQRIDERNEAYSLILLIGTVGSGKTTFVRYFKQKFLNHEHPSLSEKCDWIFLNMNAAPLASNEIYDWIKNEIIRQIKNNHCDINFDDLNIIKKLFRKEIQNFDSGLGKLYEDDSKEYNKELFSLLKKRTDDSSAYLTALLFYLKEQHGLLPIIVLDNCDKRTKNHQLLMFEVAQWVRTTYKCLVVLPMRDSTYDLYRDEPPLDTVVKDLVFRIDPPDLFKVLQARLDYITRITNQTDNTYVLRKGIRVLIKRFELVDYFKSIIKAIRENRWALDIFYRLSDRNTRKGIQLFEDFCKSGHIQADEIFQIRVSGGDVNIPPHKFLNALLRKNRRYYQGEQSNFINLFYANHQDDFPDPFIRIDILFWLRNRMNIEGPAKTKGIFQVAQIIQAMQIIGHDERVAHREIEYLLTHGLIISETLTNEVDDEDSVKITIPGVLHLKLLRNVTYLAACAEDVVFKDSGTMMSISNRLSSDDYLSKLSAVVTAAEMVHYLISYRAEYCSCPDSYVDDNQTTELYNLQDCKEAIDKFISSDSYIKEMFFNLQTYTAGSQMNVQIVHKKKSGILCHAVSNPAIRGFLSTLDKQYQISQEKYDSLNDGDILVCEVIRFDHNHNSFQLKFITHDNPKE